MDTVWGGQDYRILESLSEELGCEQSPEEADGFEGERARRKVLALVTGAWTGAWRQGTVLCVGCRPGDTSLPGGRCRSQGPFLWARAQPCVGGRWEEMQELWCL